MQLTEWLAMSHASVVFYLPPWVVAYCCEKNTTGCKQTLLSVQLANLTRPDLHVVQIQAVHSEPKGPIWPVSEITDPSCNEATV